jgi:hypothetical protein
MQGTGLAAFCKVSPAALLIGGNCFVNNKICDRTRNRAKHK